MTADTYTLKNLKDMEGQIIEALDFELNRTTTLQLLEAISDSMPEKHLSFCKYVLESAAFEGVARNFDPYTLVMASISLSDSVFKAKTELKLQCSTKVPSDKLVNCFKELVSMLQTGNRYELKAVRRKYARSKNHNVSKLQISIS